MKKNIKWIIFDVDWVIITSQKFSDQYQKKYGISDFDMTPFFIWDFKKCIIWEADLNEVIKPYLKKWKWEKGSEEILDFWFKISNNIDKRILKMVRKLKDNWIKCFIATNQEKYRTNYMKKDMWFDDTFDFVFSSCELWYKKPDEKFYLSVLDYLKNNYWISKKEILFFDDCEKNITKAKDLWIESHLYSEYTDFEKIIKNIL